jgi:hypothetical protein
MRLAAGVGLEQFLTVGGAFLFRFVNAVQRLAAGFGDGRVALALRFVDGGGEFLQAAALGLQVGFLLDADLFLFEVAVFGDEVLVHQPLEVFGALAGDGHGLFELPDHLLGRATLGFALGDLGVDARDAGLVFAVLAVEDALFLRDAPDIDGGRRLDARCLARGDRGQQRTGAGGLQLRRGQVVGRCARCRPGPRWRRAQPAPARP